MVRERVTSMPWFLGATAAVVGTVFFLLSPRTHAFAAECPHDAAHWYAVAQSGWPAIGTKVDTHTPSSWSVDRRALSTSDNASWLINAFNTQIALEGGYFSGFFPYDGTWTDGLRPYETTDNGLFGSKKTLYIPANTLIGMYTISGATVKIDVWGGPSHIWNFPYGVPNGLNYSQGEVTLSTKTWMNGGSGTQQAGFWSPDGANFYVWGWHNDCANSPYWIQWNDGNHWTSGGYGN